jgi:hypothetical protein
LHDWLYVCSEEFWDSPVSKGLNVSSKEHVPEVVVIGRRIFVISSCYSIV